uniref:Uncharacterized protein n=1 Tax=Cyanoderma ruficeps TaxID=181631 RepID=A0A8C3RJ45_9PASS
MYPRTLCQREPFLHKRLLLQSKDRLHPASWVCAWQGLYPDIFNPLFPFPRERGTSLSRRVARPGPRRSHRGLGRGEGDASPMAAPRARPRGHRRGPGCSFGVGWDGMSGEPSPVRPSPLSFLCRQSLSSKELPTAVSLTLRGRSPPSSPLAPLFKIVHLLIKLSIVYTAFHIETNYSLNVPFKTIHTKQVMSIVMCKHGSLH